MGLVHYICHGLAALPCTPSNVNEMKVSMGRCWRHPWISLILVLGIIAANVMIIKGSQDAAEAMGSAITHISVLAKEGITTIDSVQEDLNSINNVLGNYTAVAVAIAGSVRGCWGRWVS